MLTFQNLKNLGLFAESDSFQLTSVAKLAAAVSALPRKSNFRAIARKLNLVSVVFTFVIAMMRTLRRRMLCTKSQFIQRNVVNKIYLFTQVLM